MAAPPGLAPLAATPYMGWSSWYGQRYTLNEASILSAVDRMVTSGLRDAGYNYVWLDAGWWRGTRDANGTIAVDANQWPHGMKAIADYIHSAGMKAGMYTDAGYDGCLGPAQGSRGYYDHDVATFAAWGYDAIKYDNCGAFTGSGSVDVKGVFTEISAAVAKSPRPMLLAFCHPSNANDSWEYGPYTAHSFRTSGDISTVPWQTGWGSATTGYGVGIIGNFDVNVAHPGSNGPGHWNDPDNLQIGTPYGLLDVEARSQISLWAIMASPLMIGGDVRVLTQSQIDDLKNPEMIAIDQDPLGVTASKASDDGGGRQVWSKVLQQPGARAVALLNRSDVAAPITVRASDVALVGTFSVRDVWAHADRGIVSEYTVTVPSHGVALLTLAGTDKLRTSAAINAGGNAAEAFSADTNSLDGGTGWVSNAASTEGVVRPAPSAVYQSARGGINGSPMQYFVGNLQVGGTYRVRLHFSENWLYGAGARRFNVRINGAPVLTKFDIFQAAGGKIFAAVLREFDVVAAQGFVSIDFSKGTASDPLINGIEVLSAAGLTDPPTAYPVVPPDTFPPNLALNAVATASSQWDANYAASAANDGDAVTRWNAGAFAGAGQWLQLDFGASRTFDTTRISQAFDRITAFKIQYSNDSTWSDLITAGPLGPGRTDTFTPVKARRVRMLVVSTASDIGGGTPTIYEFEVGNRSGTELPADTPATAPSGTTPTTPPGDTTPTTPPSDATPDPVVPQNLALLSGVVASASSAWSGSYAAGAAVDGSAATRWNSAPGTSGGQWLQIDFPQSRTFDAVRITQSFDRITAHKIQYSSDSNWSDVVSDSTRMGSNRTHTFNPIKARRVRLFIVSTLGDAGGATPSIVEFEVGNRSGTELAADTPATTPSDPTTPPGDTTTPPTTSTPQNLSRLPGVVATASSRWSDAYGPAATIDGSDATRWNSGYGTSGGEWLQLDFGTPQTFDKTVIREAFGRIAAFKIQYASGTGWVDVVTGNTIGASRTDTFTAVTASSVRLLVQSTTSNGGGNSPTIVEFEIWSSAGNGDPGEGTTPSDGTSPVTFGGTDTVTRGTWKGVYGAESALLALDDVRVQSGTTMTFAGKNDYAWNPSTSDTRALQRAVWPGRVAATWYGAAFTMRTAFTDGASHRVSLYVLDWDSGGRSEKVEVVDSATGAVLDTQTISGFSGGVYLRWHVRGDVTFRVTALTGPNAVTSALFVDPASSP